MSIEVNTCSSNKNHLHFLLVPLLEQGHMIPMVDLALLLASHDTLVTLATTPVNLARIRPIVDRAALSSLPIRFASLHFPVANAGLPEGCENADLIPSVDLFLPFLKALSLLREPLEAYLRNPDSSAWPKPSCIISDSLQHWTADIALSFDIPRIIFHGPSCFFLLCYRLIHQQKAELEASLEAASGQPITLPGLPHSILVRKHEVIGAWRSDPDWSNYREIVLAAEESADGALVNSYYELEPLYFESYREATRKPVWPVGPLSLYKEELDAKATRGGVSSIDNKLLFQWLDKQGVGSVVLVSFGSLARNSKAQLVEVGHGLEASGRAFVWVVKESAEGLDEWMEEFEERLEGRGMVIRGWAPQAVILGHAAVGGFVTHCGWNSVLEAVAAGVVMATWPHFGDQFLNERFVVDVLKIGVAVGVQEPTMFGAQNGNEGAVKVKRGQVEEAVEELMDGGEEGEERRERVRELKEKARMAVEEGGSSWKGLQDVIGFVSESLEKKEKKQN